MHQSKRKLQIDRDVKLNRLNELNGLDQIRKLIFSLEDKIKGDINLTDIKLIDMELTEMRFDKNEDASRLNNTDFNKIEMELTNLTNQQESSCSKDLKANDANSIYKLIASVKNKFGDNEKIDKLIKYINSSSNLEEELNIMDEFNKSISSETDQKLEELIEESFLSNLIEDDEHDELKSHITNRDKINLKAFNGHLTLNLILEDRLDDYSNIQDMCLAFDFNKSKLKFWPDKFYLFYAASKEEHRIFIEILKMILSKRFNCLKKQLLCKFKNNRISSCHCAGN